MNASILRAAVCAALATAAPAVGAQLAWGTYDGAAGDDLAFAVAPHPSGGVVVVGETTSTSFPTVGSVFDTSHNGGEDVFVTRYDDTGVILWSTLLGGSSDDAARDVVVTPTGTVLVTGATTSSNFPTTLGAHATSGTGGFITELSADGSALVGSTIVTGAKPQRILRNDTTGAITVAGFVTSGPSTLFVTTLDAHESTYQGGTADGFVSCYDAALAALTYSTFLGGAGFDGVFGMVEGSSASTLILTGETASSDFVTTVDAVQSTYGGGTGSEAGDAFIVRLLVGTPGVAGVDYGSYLGGSSRETGFDIEVDGTTVTVAGQTDSSDFTTTVGAYQTTYGGGPSGGSAGDVFITCVDTSLAGALGLTYSTYIGGAANDHPLNMSVDASGTLTLVGAVSSLDFDTTSDAFDVSKNGGEDGFIVRFDPSTSTLVSSSYFGGLDRTGLRDAAVSGNSVVFAAQTRSSDLPTTPGASDATHNGEWDIYVADLTIDECDGSFEVSGAGCPSSFGIVPVLDIVGCSTSSERVWLTIRYVGLSGGTAFLFFGLGTDTVSIKPTCALENGPLTPLVLTLPLAPSAITGSALQVSGELPIIAAMADLYVQVAVVDPDDTIDGVGVTNVVKMTLAP